MKKIIRSIKKMLGIVSPSEPSIKMNVGMSWCGECEYKLRCSECAAHHALEFVRHANTCNNCKYEGCLYRPLKEGVRINCIFWTDDPAGISSELDAIIKAASKEQPERQET